MLLQFYTTDANMRLETGIYQSLIDKIQVYNYATVKTHTIFFQRLKHDNITFTVR